MQATSELARTTLPDRCWASTKSARIAGRTGPIEHSGGHYRAVWQRGHQGGERERSKKARRYRQIHGRSDRPAQAENRSANTRPRSSMPRAGGTSWSRPRRFWQATLGDAVALPLDAQRDRANERSNTIVFPSRQLEGTADGTIGAGGCEGMRRKGLTEQLAERSHERTLSCDNRLPGRARLPKATRRGQTGRRPYAAGDFADRALAPAERHFHSAGRAHRALGASAANATTSDSPAQSSWAEYLMKRPHALISLAMYGEAHRSMAPTLGVRRRNSALAAIVTGAPCGQ